MDLVAAFLLGAAFSAIVLDHRKTHSKSGYSGSIPTSGSGYSEPAPLRVCTTQTPQEEMDEDPEA